MPIISTSYPVRFAKTGSAASQKINARLKLGTLEPNAEIATVAISRNVPLEELVDGVSEYKLPSGYNQTRTYWLFHIEATETEWVLSLVADSDNNQPVPQTHTVELFS